MESVFSWKRTFESVFIARSSPPGLSNVNNLAGNLFLKKTKPIFLLLTVTFLKVSSRTRFQVLLYLISNWHCLCFWSGFNSPRIRTFVEKRFQRLFSKKKGSKSGVVPSFWIEAEVNFFRTGKRCPRDYLDYLKNRAKSGDMAVLQLNSRNMSLGKCPKIDRLPASRTHCLTSLFLTS